MFSMTARPPETETVNRIRQRAGFAGAAQEDAEAEELDYISSGHSHSSIKNRKDTSVRAGRKPEGGRVETRLQEVP